MIKAVFQQKEFEGKWENERRTREKKTLASINSSSASIVQTGFFVRGSMQTHTLNEDNSESIEEKK